MATTADNSAMKEILDACYGVMKHLETLELTPETEKENCRKFGLAFTKAGNLCWDRYFQLLDEEEPITHG